ncbi:MAG: coproporphyrinogen dehydrogenase HemZ [Ruminococcus sp.]
MKIFIENHPFHYEIENIARLFFPYEKLEVIKDNSKEKDGEYILTTVDSSIRVTAVFTKYEKSLTADKTDDDKSNEQIICSLLFKILTDYTGITMPWGMITGVRPVKYLRSVMMENGEDYARNYFKNYYYVTEEKLALATKTEKYERKILNSSKENSFSLYVSIPFCPSRCSYCSFVSQSVERTKHLIEPYVDLLCKEVSLTGEIAKKHSLKLETVYIGGGTPTTLNPKQLEKLINAINSSFNMEECREYTVEAGRPDTITPEKLRVLKDGGVTRISINPQTLNDKVLNSIGRRHTTEETLKAFKTASTFNFNTVNSDLIAGLPHDTFESFSESLDKIIDLDINNITVHTLSIKRSADYTEKGLTTNRQDAERTGKMLSYAEKRLTQEGYIPYYLYRQSRMVGNYENVGWSKPGHEGLYNVFIMDETHSILACGAGAVTKLKNHKKNDLMRIFNYKFPYEYIDKFEEILNRKKNADKFFTELTK